MNRLAMVADIDATHKLISWVYILRLILAFIIAKSSTCQQYRFNTKTPKWHHPLRRTANHLASQLHWTPLTLERATIYFDQNR